VSAKTMTVKGWPTRQHNPPRTYRLYIYRFKFGDITNRRIKTRGKCVGEFTHYKLLVAEAERRAVSIGYPRSAWLDLFDWNV
jgi:hypothetical protein